MNIDDTMQGWHAFLFMDVADYLDWNCCFYVSIQIRAQ